MTRRISKKSLVSLTFFALLSFGGSAVIGQVPIVKIDGSALEPAPTSAPPVVAIVPIEELDQAKSSDLPGSIKEPLKRQASMPPGFLPRPGTMLPAFDIPIVKMEEADVKSRQGRPRMAAFAEPAFGDVMPPPIVLQEPIASPSDIIIEMKKSDFRRPIPSSPIVPSVPPAKKNQLPETEVSGKGISGQNSTVHQPSVPVRPLASDLTPSQIFTPRSLPELPRQSKIVTPAIEDFTIPFGYANQDEGGLSGEKNKKVINPFSQASKSRIPQDNSGPIAPIAQDTTSQNAIQGLTDGAANNGTAIIQDTIVSQDLGFIDTPVTANVPIVPRSPSLVLLGEALFMTVESNSVKVNDAFGVDPFDYDLGIRITAQRIFGAEGLSVSYAGIQEWNEFGRATSPGGGLNFAPVAGSGLGATALAPFKGATFQQQYHNGNYHTLELNKVTWGWDVLNIFFGVRYTHYEEEFDFFSARADGQQGLLSIDLENHIFGPQVGGELFYDIGGRFSTGVKGKLGLMATALDRETQLISNGTNVINNTDSDVNFNFMAEFGGFVRWQVLPRGYIRGGYELWYNSSVFNVDDNIPGSITSTYGTTSVDDDLLIHGASIGFEFNW